MTENRVLPFDRMSNRRSANRNSVDRPRWLIAQAVEAEFETFPASTADLVPPDGRRRVVRRGHDPVRATQTGSAPSRSAKAEGPRSRSRFGRAHSLQLEHPAQMARRTKSLDALLPVLYLRGILAGDFQKALAALLGRDAPNLSAAVIARLKNDGTANIGDGRSVICRRAITSTSGRTASICRPA
jgi:putative transposase